MRPPKPVGWCDEHRRYFFWTTGCSATAPIPTRLAIRAWYRQQTSAWFRHTPGRQP